MREEKSKEVFIILEKKYNGLTKTTEFKNKEDAIYEAVQKFKTMKKNHCEEIIVGTTHKITIYDEDGDIYEEYFNGEIVENFWNNVDHEETIKQLESEIDTLFLKINHLEYKLSFMQ